MLGVALGRGMEVDGGLCASLIFVGTFCEDESEMDKILDSLYIGVNSQPPARLRTRSSNW